MTYLLVDGAAGTALVEAGAVESELLQPVSSIPIARPSSTTRVDIRFIDKPNLYQNPKPDKQNIHPIYKQLTRGVSHHVMIVRYVFDKLSCCTDSCGDVAGLFNQSEVPG